MHGGTAERDRNVGAAADSLGIVAGHSLQRVTIQNKCRAAIRNVLAHERITGIKTEPRDVAVVACRLGHKARVVGVEYQRARSAHGVAHDPLDIEQLIQVA